MRERILLSMPDISIFELRIICKYLVTVSRLSERHTDGAIMLSIGSQTRCHLVDGIIMVNTGGQAMTAAILRTANRLSSAHVITIGITCNIVDLSQARRRLIGVTKLHVSLALSIHIQTRIVDSLRSANGLLLSDLVINIVIVCNIIQLIGRHLNGFSLAKETPHQFRDWDLTTLSAQSVP